MKKEILPQYVYRDKIGNSTALKEYYSLKFDKVDSCYEYIWKNILLQEAILLCNLNQSPNIIENCLGVILALINDYSNKVEILNKIMLTL